MIHRIDLRLNNFAVKVSIWPYYITLRDKGPNFRGSAPQELNSHLNCTAKRLLANSLTWTVTCSTILIGWPESCARAHLVSSHHAQNCILYYKYLLHVRAIKIKMIHRIGVPLNNLHVRELDVKTHLLQSHVPCGNFP